MTTRHLKIALYSHDTMGLGHMRRNLLVANALTSLRPAPSILMLFGAREAAAYPLPPGVEAVTLPAFQKGADGSYRARSLDVSLKSLVDLRAGALLAVLDSFAPDLLVVDKVPRGVFGELEPALRALRSRHGTRCVLGLRDLLDEAGVVRREWAAEGMVHAVRQYYDAIWVYGDRRVCDPVTEYGLPREAARKLRFTGYLDPRERWTVARDHAPDPPARPYALCMVGGGQDGDRLAEAFAAAVRPPGWDGVIVAGPFMAGAALDRITSRMATDPGLHLHRFLTDTEPLMRGAERVVTMGGYNSITEVVAFRKPALVVPRVEPRVEQLLRAERLERLGLVDLLLPAAMAPEHLGTWLAGPLPCRPTVSLDFGGATRVPHLAAQLLRRPVRPAVPADTTEGLVQRVAV